VAHESLRRLHRGRQVKTFRFTPRPLPAALALASEGPDDAKAALTSLQKQLRQQSQNTNSRLPLSPLVTPLGGPMIFVAGSNDSSASTAMRGQAMPGDRVASNGRHLTSGGIRATPSCPHSHSSGHSYSGGGGGGGGGEEEGHQSAAVPTTTPAAWPPSRWSCTLSQAIIALHLTATRITLRVPSGPRHTRAAHDPTTVMLDVRVNNHVYLATGVTIASNALFEQARNQCAFGENAILYS
jgi:hypothetical protein